MIVLSLIHLPTSKLVQVAWSESLGDMVKFIEGEVSLLPYQDGFVTKVFKMGSVLEEFGPTDHPLLKQYGVAAISDVGTLEGWVAETTRNYNTIRETLHEVPKLQE